MNPYQPNLYQPVPNSVPQAPQKQPERPSSNYQMTDI